MVFDFVGVFGAPEEGVFGGETGDERALAEGVEFVVVVAGIFVSIFISRKLVITGQ